MAFGIETTERSLMPPFLVPEQLWHTNPQAPATTLNISRQVKGFPIRLTIGKCCLRQSRGLVLEKVRPNRCDFQKRQLFNPRENNLSEIS